jgi:dTDP-glucose 4,6-dehydratase
MSEKVLITGAAGFVGHHTLAYLLKNTDYNFVATDSFKHKGTSARLRSVFEEVPDAATRVKVITHDLTTPIDLVTKNEMGNIDYILNLASESHVDRSIVEPRDFILNNTNLILTMLEFARASDNLKLFIQMSTDEVYGPAAAGHNHTEWETHYPSNPYSASKASQEDISYSYWRTFGIPIVVTNTMNIIGERQDTEKFIPLIIRNVTKQLPVLVHAQKINDNGWKSGSRYYLHARNQADALKFILDKCNQIDTVYQKNDKVMEKFNIVGEKEVSNDNIVKLICEIMNVESNITYLDFHSARPGHDLRYALDGQKMKNLGWKPPVPFEESLRKTVNWYVNNPSWIV